MHSENGNLWTRVTRHNRCPICGKPDWCGISVDKSMVICMREEKGSKGISKNGGYIHIIGPGLFDHLKPRPRPAPAPKPNPSEYWAQLASKCMFTLDDDHRAALGRMLGVTTESLVDVFAGWYSPSGAYSFPMFMFNGSGKPAICGIRLRDPVTGRKFCVTGSRTGIFMPGTDTAGELLLIVEGPSDMAAALTLGFSAIGRPCNVGGEDDIAAAVCLSAWGRTIKQVCIITDRDTGSAETATAMAAKRLATRLHRHKPVKILRPPACKDLREWLRQGLTTAMLETVIRNADLFNLVRPETIEHKF